MLADALTRDSTLGIKSIGFTCRLLFDEAQVENAVDAPAESKDAEKGGFAVSQVMLGDAKLRGDSSPISPSPLVHGFFGIALKLTTPKEAWPTPLFLAAILKGHLSIGFQASAKCCGSLQENEKKRRNAVGAVTGLQFQYLVS